MGIENCAVPCKGCPKAEIFKSANDASKSNEPIIKSIGEGSLELLKLRNKTSPQIEKGKFGSTTLCCKQPEAMLVESSLKRYAHAIIKTEKASMDQKEKGDSVFNCLVTYFTKLKEYVK